MALLDDLPDAVRASLVGVRDGEELVDGTRLSLAGDIGRDGSFGERWLIADRRAVYVATVGKGGGVTRDLELALSQIREVRIDTLVGSGALIVETNSGATIEALRFSAALAPKFGVAARALEAMAKDEEPPETSAADVERKVCPKCGDPLPDDTNVCVKCVDKRAVLRRLLSYAFPFRMQCILIAVLMLAGTAVGVVPPIFQQRLTDEVLVPHKHFGWIGGIVLGLILVSVLSRALTIWRGRLAAWISNRMVYVLRTQAYNRLQDLSLGYYDKRQTGSLLARVTQDVNELQNFMVDGIQFFLVNSLTIVGILVIMFRYNWLLTLLVLIPVPITVYLVNATWKRLRGRLVRLYYLRSNLSASLTSVLSGVRVVKAFAQEEREKDQFEDRSAKLRDATSYYDMGVATYFPMIEFVTTLGVYIIWLIGGREVFGNLSNKPSEGMTLGVLGMFLSYTAMLLGPLQGMTRIADWLSRSTASAERVFEVIDAEPDIQSAEDAVRMPRIEGHVELRSVRFSYDKNQPVLDGVSIDVKAGEMIGLVGHSGAGKSTIINLLSRFYDVKEGAILIDGVDIRKIDLGDLRRQIGVVLQEPYLFPGSIADNIKYAHPDAGPEEIMQAAKAANAHEFIMRFPDGYDTFVGERGARLSGGERQRISIARAILHDPRILILDEATASVDTQTEKKIQDAIARLVAGRTTFAIAHRLSTLRNADRLMVIERGKLVELGTHDELLAKPDGVFRKLVDLQREVNQINEL
ncbi:ABC transporter [Capsulimonas corticalis]|uniref:ABC transporter n=1 Tax=Capsulimonas corticalis TaxID=2219043 RepID=A0A402D029_9BACT|nr:ABC transporter transmembrane domain-containing protein [Capsulimonas corticalis]BDI33810.1 ABC transporter [Capsulimonas corticalis]